MSRKNWKHFVGDVGRRRPHCSAGLKDSNRTLAILFAKFTLVCAIHKKYYKNIHIGIYIYTRSLPGRSRKITSVNIFHLVMMNRVLFSDLFLLSPLYMFHEHSLGFYELLKFSYSFSLYIAIYNEYYINSSNL